MDASNRQPDKKISLINYKTFKIHKAFLIFNKKSGA